MEDEVGIITLLRVFWKHRLLIFVGTPACALVALVISVLMPHVYKIDMLVENVKTGRDKAGEIVYLGDLKSVKPFTEAGAFDQEILDTLKEQHGSEAPKRLSFQVSLENNNQFARIAYETANVELGKKILLQLLSALKKWSLERIDHWKKGIDNKIEKKRGEISKIKIQLAEIDRQIALKAKTELRTKQNTLAIIRADKSDKEDMIKRLQKEISNIAAKKKIEMSEKISDMKAEKSRKEDMIRRLQKEINSLWMKKKIEMSEKISDMNAEKGIKRERIKNIQKRNTEINSSIKLIKREIDFLISKRKELVSKRNETRNMGAVGELSLPIMDGYHQLTKLRQAVNNNYDLILQERRGIQKLDAGIRSLKDDATVTPKEIKVLNDRIGQARLDIKELDAKINALKDHATVTPKEIKVLNDRIGQARLDIKALESRAKKLSDELAMSSSTDKPSSLLEAAIAKPRDQMALITEEIGTLEENKKKVKNIVLLQPPTSSLSPLRPDTKRNVVIWAIVGLFLALFLSVFLEYVYKREA